MWYSSRPSVLSPLYILRQGLSLHVLWFRQTNWPARSREFPASFFLMLRLKACTACLIMETKEPSLGPCTCLTNPLPIEPSPQLQLIKKPCLTQSFLDFCFCKLQRAALYWHLFTFNATPFYLRWCQLKHGCFFRRNVHSHGWATIVARGGTSKR